jgi:ABC-type transport system involved in multi-copper enzyme maturation permease subunit
MLLFGVFIAIFVGVGLVYKEMERRTIYAIFAKPVGRGEFLVGKYLGLCLTLLVNVVVMGLGVSLALVYVSRGWDPLIVNLWPAVLLIYLELAILTGIALLFSSFSSPALSALLTFFVFIIGHFSADLKSLSVSLGTVGARFITPTAHGHSPSPGFVAAVTVYAVVYITIILAIATLVFSRRNFK